MQTNELRDDRLRELTRIRPGGARVLSIFVNLDPGEFAAPPARATEISSVIDAARRQIRDSSDLSHDERKALDEDVERADAYLRDLSPKGAHGLALFACGPADLFEAIRLPRPVPTRAVVDDSPFIEPLVELLGTSGNWMVALVNRQVGRMLRGDRDHLDELPVIEDEVHGQHSQGGWSQARYQRSVDEDVQEHLKNVADALFVHFKRHSFDHLLLGGPADVITDFEGKLHQYLKDRLAGRIDIDVENTSVDDVASTAGAKIQAFEQAAEREALERLREGVSRGTRGAAGLDAVLAALNERRVETLLVNQGFQAAGCSCPQCGSVYSQDGGKCPADGSELDCRDDVLESAVRLALEQSAKVLVFGYDDDNRDELESHGDIAAVLRF
jgi:peptide chain release factor subunit 1